MSFLNGGIGFLRRFNRHMRLTVLLLTTTGLIATNAAFAANIIRYSDRNAFTTDTTGRQVIDFEDARQCGAITDQFNPVALRGVTFAGGANRGTGNAACTPPLSRFQNWVFSVRLFGNTRETQTLVTTLPGGTMAVAFDMGVRDEVSLTGAVTITVHTSDGMEQSFDVNTTTVQTGNQRQLQPVFVGLTSSRPITALHFRIRDIPDAFLIVDNLTMGQTAPPAINVSGGVVNGGSFSAPVSPHSWVTIFGRVLSGTDRIWGGPDFTGNRLPTQIDDVSVTFNGKSAYVYYVSPVQLNVLTPGDLTDGPAVVEVSRGVLKSQPFTVQVQRAAPGLFMFNPENRRYVAASRNDGSIIGKTTLYPGVTTPARPGEVISLWGTGFGRTDPAIPEGQIVPSPLRLAATPVVTIAGATAEVLFAGLTTPGLYQFNVRVPETVPDGDALVRIQIEGTATQDNAYITVGR